MRRAAFVSMMFLAIFSATASGCKARDSSVRRAIVRVITADGQESGTGFFVKGPEGDDSAYVATAYHVIDSGKRLILERNEEASEKEEYVEAYPDTEVVAFNAQADVAIIRVKNLPSAKVRRLDLAGEPVKDEAVVSWGFPVSNLTNRLGLTKKDGKVLNFAKFPVVDRLYRRVVRENAVEGLIISTDIEPGFSGGPTCNEAGQVVGINVLKDSAYRGQNGAIHVSVLKELIAGIHPYIAPSAAEVTALLKRVQTEMLMVPVQDRTNIQEAELLSTLELPRLRELIAELRRAEADDDPDHGTVKGLSDRAMLGVALARLPGPLLETYHADSTQKELSECKRRTQGMRRFLGEIGLGQEAADSSVQDCADLARRPILWDLVAATFQWERKPVEYTVTTIEEVDAETLTFRANVRIGAAPNVVPVYVSSEHGRLRLKLFDNNDKLYALDAPGAAIARDFEGVWIHRSPAAPVPGGDGDTEEKEERLNISIQNGKEVGVRQEFFLRKQSKGPGWTYACTRLPTVTGTVVQSLTGQYKNGVIVASLEGKLDRGGDCKVCGCYTADKAVVLKLFDGRLIMYRTDGAQFPETVEFTRK